MNFIDPVTKKTQKQTLTASVSENEENFQFLDKKAQHKKLLLLCDSLKEGQKESSQIRIAKFSNLKDYIVAESVKHQVLCTETAFICVEKELVDGKLQEVQQTGKVNVIVPQFLKE